MEFLGTSEIHLLEVTKTISISNRDNSFTSGITYSIAIAENNNTFNLLASE